MMVLELNLKTTDKSSEISQKMINFKIYLKLKLIVEDINLKIKVKEAPLDTSTVQ